MSPSPRRSLFLCLAPALLLVLSACASQSLDQKLFAANADVRTVLQATDTALNAHLITADQAQSVSNVTRQVGPLIDSAKAANDAKDTTNANKTAALVTQLLAGLKAYVAPAKTP